MSQLGKVLLWFSLIAILTLGIGFYFLKIWIPFFWILIVLTLLFLSIALFKDFQYYKEFYNTKTTRHGISMGSLILMVIGFVLMANILGVRNNKTWDFSISESNSLSEQSQSLLHRLDSDLKIIFFYKIGTEGVEENRRLFRELVKKYQDVSTHVSLEFVEMNERPDIVSEFAVDKGSGVVFVSYKNNKNRVDKIEEQDLTMAILKVTQTNKKNIYFIEGHGELNLEDSQEAKGLNALKMMLENNQFSVRSIVLNQNPNIPQDADIVAIIGAQQNFMEFEIKALENYLSQGGALLISAETIVDLNVYNILNKLGIKIENQFVLNYVNYAGQTAIDPASPTLAAVFSPSSPIVKNFDPKSFTLFRLPNYFKRMTPIEGVEVDDLVRTNQQTLAFTDLKFKAQTSAGPFSLAMAIQGVFPSSKDSKKFRLLTFADSDFLSNSLLFQNLNRDLALGSINWLARDESHIAITPKEFKVTKIFLSDTQFGLYLWGFIIPLPLIFLFAAVYFKLKRRAA